MTCIIIAGTYWFNLNELEDDFVLPRIVFASFTLVVYTFHQPRSNARRKSHYDVMLAITMYLWQHWPRKCPPDRRHESTPQTATGSWPSCRQTTRTSSAPWRRRRKGPTSVRWKHIREKRDVKRYFDRTAEFSLIFFFADDVFHARKWNPVQDWERAELGAWCFKNLKYYSLLIQPKLTSL